MKYNDDLNTNNNALRNILQTINNLPSAGGGGDFPYEYAQGTFSVSEKYYAYMNVTDVADHPYSFAHGMNTTPNLVYIWCDLLENTSNVSAILEVFAVPPRKLYNNASARYFSTTGMRRLNGSTSATAVYDNNTGTDVITRKVVDMDGTNIWFGGNSPTNWFLPVGLTYHWIAMTLPTE